MAGDDGEETGDAFVSRARVWLEPRGRGESRSCLLCHYTHSSGSFEFKKYEKARVCPQATRPRRDPDATPTRPRRDPDATPTRPRRDSDATPTLCFIMVYYMFNATSKLPGANAQKHILASARAHKLAYVCRNSPADSLGESCITALPQQLPYCYCYCYCYYCYCYCYCYCYYSCYCSYYYYDYKYYYDD